MPALFRWASNRDHVTIDAAEVTWEAPESPLIASRRTRIAAAGKGFAPEKKRADRDAAPKAHRAPIFHLLP